MFSTSMINLPTDIVPTEERASANQVKILVTDQAISIQQFPNKEGNKSQCRFFLVYYWSQGPNSLWLGSMRDVKTYPTIIRLSLKMKKDYRVVHQCTLGEQKLVNNGLIRVTFVWRDTKRDI